VSPQRRSVRGLRALDLTSLADGPSAGTLLAHLGADVIRVEPPGGDPGRAVVDWASAARRSRSLTLELSEAHGADILLRLAEDADVVIERFPTGTMEAWGVGPDELHDANPDLVIVRGAGDPATLLEQALGTAGLALEPADAGPGPSGPELGRHTEELFAELGFTRGELEDLRAAGVV
jgi:crotonobetainyl-CoA:carnitine CoA-transferase CaiB-like acyl-CoA transferase